MLLTLTEFKNEVFTNFAKKENLEKMEQALELVYSQIYKEYPLIIGEKIIKTKDKFKSLNPSNPSEIIGVFQSSTIKETEAAIFSAEKSFQIWSKVPVEKRVDILRTSASIMRERKFELSAALVLEVGKNWIEADADVAEGIDFLEFYSREMLRYSEEQPLTKISGEKNEFLYIPLGVVAVISPWNFPLAIMAGMTSAAIIAGNTVVLKPSSDAPMSAYKFLEILREAGLPPGVVNFLTGSGEEIGDFLSAHPKVRMLAFTGSKEVGLRINKRASEISPGQIWIKRVIAEMGGKNAVIVEDDCDLDLAVDGVAASAFGYQGQKCSACSRAIVNEKIYEEFLKKLIERTKKISIGPVKDYKNWLGPVINAKAENKILKYIEIGKKEGRLVFGGDKIKDLLGYFIQPAIFSEIKTSHTIAQEEIFGPVLAVMASGDFNQALQIANNTQYGLTGAVYTKNKEKLKRAKIEFHCGNLYLNKKCTGAVVGVHPFGGFNMSGTNSKAGGREYLLYFLQGKTISGKIL